MKLLTLLLLLLLPPGLMAQTVPLGQGFGTGAANEKSLLVNGNFEHGTDGWELVAFGKKGTMTIDTKELRNGKPTLRIDNLEGDHTFVRQTVKGKPNARYRLTGYVKTLKVAPVKGTGKEGAALLVGMGPETAGLQKSTGWKRLTMDFTPKDPNDIRVGPSLGSYARPVTGTAWFSEITLTEIGGR